MSVMRNWRPWCCGRWEAGARWFANITGGNATFSPAKACTGITTIIAGTLQSSASNAFGTAANITVNGGARPATSDPVIGDSTGVAVEQNARASLKLHEDGRTFVLAHAL
jgi:hypothetical protein